jgi:hypothetical protein
MNLLRSMIRSIMKNIWSIIVILLFASFSLVHFVLCVCRLLYNTTTFEGDSFVVMKIIALTTYDNHNNNCVIVGSFCSWTYSEFRGENECWKFYLFLFCFYLGEYNNKNERETFCVYFMTTIAAQNEWDNLSKTEKNF